MLGQYEIWQLINLTGDTHPIHLHLDPFQILARHAISYEIPEGGIEDRELTAAIKLERDADDDLDHAIDDNERGLKDTIRVNPNELVEIAVCFNTYSGRYMYHCHILEHEDRDMMRPFVTMPPDLMPFMAGPSVPAASVWSRTSSPDPMAMRVPRRDRAGRDRRRRPAAPGADL
jgi:spore coat protein A